VYIVLLAMAVLFCFCFVFLVYVAVCLIVFGCQHHAVDCLERLVSEVTYYVLNGTLNPTHSLTNRLMWKTVIGFII